MAQQRVTPHGRRVVTSLLVPAAALAAALGLAACGGSSTAAAPVTASPSTTTAGTTSPTATAGPTGSAATPSRTGSATTTTSAAAQPSPTAAMVCGSEIRDDLVTALQLSAAPSTTSTYVDRLFTCTYHLAQGPLVLSVMDTTDVPSATRYYDALRRELGNPRPLSGVASLGLPSVQTTSGVVVFLKDDKTLEVDASALPATVGPNHQTRADLAYQMATDVIGCWREH